MSTLRPFEANDLFKFNHVNLDPLTETYSMQFYMVQYMPRLTHCMHACNASDIVFMIPVCLQQYLTTWPGMCASYEDANGRLMGYIIGDLRWHACNLQCDCMYVH